jgi:hypothetical protein
VPIPQGDVDSLHLAILAHKNPRWPPIGSYLVWEGWSRIVTLLSRSP